jgi:Cu+-exporting ATPase
MNKEVINPVIESSSKTQNSRTVSQVQSTSGSKTTQFSVCYHCGAQTRKPIVKHDHDFCCAGCLGVYEIIEKNNLCEYYNFNQTPGVSLDQYEEKSYKFDFLENQEIVNQLIKFKSGTQIHLDFYLPQVHCSSCLYLLENLYQIQSGVLSSKLNFSRKELSVVFDSEIISAKQIAEFLTKLGYEPYFSLSDLGDNKGIKSPSKSRIYKLGVAGFAFGNIMLLSFPEYFAYGTDLDGLKPYFQWIILGLIVPVMTYSSTEFYKLAWGGLKQRYLNIDLPIVLAMIITFSRSIYEVFSHTGPGYFDSLSGIVFFMLLGRILQDRTYKSITFNRDFTSYFPISSTVFKEGREFTVPIVNIAVNDELIIHDQEIVPVDGLLVSGKALIDYSFVTGESNPVELEAGSWIYAGGRQLGASIRILSQKTVSQSYLVSLWNKNDQKEQKSPTIESTYVQKASMYFTLVLFTIAATAAIYWGMNDPSKIWNAVTAVLIVACPCALLLSVTFTHGHILSLLARHGFYLKSARVIERMNQIKHIVFDKTGTLTQSQDPLIQYVGMPLSEIEMDAIASISRESTHPFGRSLAKKLNRIPLDVEFVENVPGQGMLGMCDGLKVRLGSSDFLKVSEERRAELTSPIKEEDKDTLKGSSIWVEVDGKLKGVYLFSSAIRSQLSESIEHLGKEYKLSLLSGDNARADSVIRGIFPSNTQVLFEQKPHDKRTFIEQLENAGVKTMMVGDGLNDAGALMSSSIGVAVTEDISYFTVGSDAIVLGSALKKLPQFFKVAQIGRAHV